MMTKKLWAVVLAFALAACAVPARHRRVPRPESFPPLRFEPPAAERCVLANGIVVHLLPNRELPLVRMTVSIRTGAMYEPPRLAGLAALTGAVMRTGGTAQMGSDAVDRQLEAMSARLSIGIGAEQSSAFLCVLKEDFETAFPMFAHMLMSPAFEERKFLIARRRACQGLRRLPEDPLNLAFREYKKLIYDDRPRRTLPTLATLKRITRSDLVVFHRRFFRPERIMIAVSGDFSRDAMLAALQRELGTWPANGDGAVKAAPPPPVAARRVYHLQKRLPQATIVMGHLAPPRTHPDYYAFQVLNFIIGGSGFASRLHMQVRSKQGLAYSVGSFYLADADYGVFGAYSTTRTAATSRAAAIMIDIFEQIQRGDITDGELALAREAIVNNFIFSFSSSDQIAVQQMRIEFEGLPPDFIRKTPEKIRAITLADLKRVARTWLRPDRMVVLVVGDRHGLDVPLNEWPWAPVQTITSDVLDGS